MFTVIFYSTMLFKMILILILSFSYWCINPVEVNHIALGIDKVEEKWELHFKVQLYKIKKTIFLLNYVLGWKHISFRK